MTRQVNFITSSEQTVLQFSLFNPRSQRSMDSPVDSADLCTSERYKSQKSKNSSYSFMLIVLMIYGIPFPNPLVFSVSEDVFVRSSEENHQPRDTGDQVQRRMIEEERDRRRRDVMEKLKRLSISSGDPEEPFSPLSPKSPAYMVNVMMLSSALDTSICPKNYIKYTTIP